jgi:hemolysin activation/secretion protein
MLFNLPDSFKQIFKVFAAACPVFALIFVLVPCHSFAQEQEVTFEILDFEVVGNTLLQQWDISGALNEFKGSGKTASDVEAARAALESLYHKGGYPAVLVNIPEQTVDDGFIQLDVIESKIRRIRVTGNAYYTRDFILKKLPALRPGKTLYVPEIQEQLANLNSNENITVEPTLQPGKKFGTIDVELKVTDSIPVSASLELNNKSTSSTTNLRLNANVSFDNLWQREHSVNLQYQTSPKDLDDVQVVAVSYLMPALWNTDHILSLYTVVSESESGFGEGFSVLGEGFIVGTRYIMPLPDAPIEDYSHFLTLGLDYKDFDEDLVGEALPVNYLLWSFAYSSSLRDSWGVTAFNAALNLSFRGLFADQDQFEKKRFGARGNFAYGVFGIEREQPLLGNDLSLFVQLDGQVSTQSLIDNEQYSGGGADSVRGYFQSADLGDHALHATVELGGPNLFKYFGLGEKHLLRPLLFYDYVRLWLIDTLEGEIEQATLSGLGGGFRAVLFDDFTIKTDVGKALSTTDGTEAGDVRVHFSVKYSY